MAGRDEPTEAQQAILNIIVSHVEEHGWPPTVQEWERDCADYLTGELGVEVVTSRSQSGGTQAGSDLMTVTGDGPQAHVLGWSVEVKASKDGHSPTPWCCQAAEQAGGRPWVVLAKVPHKPVADGDAYVWVEHVEGVRRMSIRWWVELVSGTLPADPLAVR